MLFEFNKFWLTLLTVVGGWIFYGFWGFELTAITLLSLILANQASNE
jgi:hypothetical protein